MKELFSDRSAVLGVGHNVGTELLPFYVLFGIGLLTQKRLIRLLVEADERELKVALTKSDGKESDCVVMEIEIGVDILPTDKDPDSAVLGHRVPKAGTEDIGGVGLLGVFKLIVLSEEGGQETEHPVGDLPVCCGVPDRFHAL